MEKVISFCGVERGDFVYYIAALLSKNGKAVLIVDNSYSNDIYQAVDFIGNITKFVVKQNITYVQNVYYSRDNDELFDYVLIWHGMNISEDELMQSDEVYLLPNYTPSCLSMVNKLIKNKDVIKGIFMRDSIVSNKITEKSVAEFLNVPLEKVVGVMVLDSKDYENYLAFLYNGRQKFSKLTPNYNDCLITVIMSILNLDKKASVSLFKRAKIATTF